MRKKLFIFAIAALLLCVMASCDKKGSKHNTKSDKDDTELVDDDDEDFYENDGDDSQAAIADAQRRDITKMLQRAYEEASLLYLPTENELVEEDEVYSHFCSKEFNEKLVKVRAIDARQSNDDDRYFSGQDLTWNYWGDGAVTPKDIEVDIKGDNEAEATFYLVCGEEWMRTKLLLRREQGEWRIHDWLEVGDHDCNILKQMDDYIKKNR